LIIGIKNVVMDKEKFVYLDRIDHEYNEIGAEYIKDSASIVEYFGQYGIDEHMDAGELVFYKLVPHLRVTKNVEYKTEEI